jgi:hypothetical protein
MCHVQNFLPSLPDLDGEFCASVFRYLALTGFVRRVDRLTPRAQNPNVILKVSYYFVWYPQIEPT